MSGERRARLARLLAPRSIAVVGASTRAGTIGALVMANLAKGYAGALHPVHPSAEAIEGRPCAPSVGAIPGPVDLAVVVVPAKAVPGVLEECGAAGVGGAVVISSGFAEVGAEGVDLGAEVTAVARRHGLPVVGPNCIGLMNVADGVVANFAYLPDDPAPTGGRVALVSQSGGFAGFTLRRARAAGVGLGWFVSTGNEADVTVSEVVEVLAAREDVDVVMAFAEQIGDGDAFRRAARTARDADTPIVLLKAGRSEVAARAAASHTASVVGSAAVVDAVCRQHGVVVVGSVDEMVDVALLLQAGVRPQGDRVAIVTGTGGTGVALADACAAAGLDVPELPATVQEELRALMPVPFHGSTANPVDVTAQAVSSPATMGEVTAVLAASGAVDAVVPIIFTGPVDHHVAAHRAGTPLVVVAPEPIPGLAEAGVASYPDPGRAARALGHAAALAARPDPAPAGRDEARARRVRSTVLAGRGGCAGGEVALGEPEGLALLAAYGVEVPCGAVCATPDEAAEVAAGFDGPAVLKAVAPGLAHKTEAGAVRLGVAADDVAAVAAELLARVPGARQVMVQVQVPATVELMVGVQRDPTFGPVVAVALGGTLVELIDDAALLVPPFGPGDVAAALARLGGGRLVGHARGLAPADVDAVARVVVAVGALAVELPEVVELDVNPLRVGDGRAVAVDALAVLR